MYTKLFHLNTAFFAILVLFISSCATQFDVATDYDQAYDFSTKRSFALVTPNQMKTVENDLVRQRIEISLRKQLSAKGFRQVSEKQADILVSYYGTSENETDLKTYQNYNSFYGYGRCFRCRVVVPTSTEVRVVEYEKGVLMIDLIDPESNKLKWRGSTSARVTTKAANSMTADERSDLTEKAVSAILSKYPPGQ